MNPDLLNKIHNLDCLDFMRSLPDKCIDLVVTDPPYDISDSKPGNSELMSLGKYNADNFAELKNGFDVEVVFSEIVRIQKKVNCFIFCANKQIAEIMTIAQRGGYYVTLLVWNKTNSAPFANGVWRQDAEFIVHVRESGAYFEGNAEEKRKVVQMPTNPSQFGHPTEKPLNLIMKYVLIGSKEGDIVFDPFMGSGTTAVAAKQLGRKFLGCELSEKYVAIANERLRQDYLF
jgi:site-specific DNA-methyltransferase (adenine-specific)